MFKNKFYILISVFLLLSCNKKKINEPLQIENWKKLNSNLMYSKQIDTLKNGNIIIYNNTGFEVFDSKTLNLIQNQSLKFNYIVNDYTYVLNTTVIDNYLIVFRKLNTLESVFMVYDFNGNKNVNEAILNIDTITEISKNNFSCNLSKMKNKNGNFDLLVEYYIDEKFVLYSINFEQLFNRFNTNNSSCIKFVSDYSQAANQYSEFMKIRFVSTDLNGNIIATFNHDFGKNLGGLVFDIKGNIVAELPTKGNSFYLENKLYSINNYEIYKYSNNYLSSEKLIIQNNLIPKGTDIKPLNNKNLFYLNNDKLITLNNEDFKFKINSYSHLSGYNLKLQNSKFTFVSNLENDMFYLPNSSLK